MNEQLVNTVLQSDARSSDLAMQRILSIAEPIIRVCVYRFSTLKKYGFSYDELHQECAVGIFLSLSSYRIDGNLAGFISKVSSRRLSDLWEKITRQKRCIAKHRSLDVFGSLNLSNSYQTDPLIDIIIREEMGLQELRRKKRTARPRSMQWNIQEWQDSRRLAKGYCGDEINCKKERKIPTSKRENKHIDKRFSKCIVYSQPKDIYSRPVVKLDTGKNYINVYEAAKENSSKHNKAMGSANASKFAIVNAIKNNYVCAGSKWEWGAIITDESKNITH